MYSSACCLRSVRPMGKTTSAKKASSFNRNRSISRGFIPQKIYQKAIECQDKLNVVVLVIVDLEDWFLFQDPEFTKKMRKARQEDLLGKDKNWESPKKELFIE
jgi:hypothetical protein